MIIYRKTMVMGICPIGVAKHFIKNEREKKRRGEEERVVLLII
jgi:hypothetical protein